jgi:hypothetical protein
MTDLNALFRATSRRQFENQMAVADRLSRLAVVREMDVAETMDALICSLCSIVQARALPAEWGDVGETICDEVKRRLLVTGDTGDEHHARRMI